MSILRSSTSPRWFAQSSRDLLALLSDHLHCERKAAENALALVRRYPHRGASVTQLSRLAHEETSHVVQVALLIAERGWTPRSDSPNHYARGLFAEVRAQEPGRLLDSLFVAAFIEARSHERLTLLARGFAPIPAAPLPFPATVVASRNDPYVAFERARAFATAWGAELVDLGDAGHINASSGLGDWAEGRALLAALVARAGAAP